MDSTPDPAVSSLRTETQSKWWPAGSLLDCKEAKLAVCKRHRLASVDRERTTIIHPDVCEQENVSFLFLSRLFAKKTLLDQSRTRSLAFSDEIKTRAVARFTISGCRHRMSPRTASVCGGCSLVLCSKLRALRSTESSRHDGNGEKRRQRLGSLQMTTFTRDPFVHVRALMGRGMRGGAKHP